MSDHAAIIKNGLYSSPGGGPSEKREAALAALDALVADRDAWIKAAADNGAAQDAAEAERDEAMRVYRYGQMPSLALRLAEARVTELEAEKAAYSTRLAADEKERLALRLRLQEIASGWTNTAPANIARAALAKEDTDE